MRLAIVEDEKNFADNILGYLQRFQKETGYQIETVWFQDGCDIAEEYKSDFDIILMDVQMKFMDGMTAVRKIREMLIDCNVSLRLSAWSDCVCKESGYRSK